jgi:1-acyl-sn-glycerol-3-phosphate acyltransferase
VEIFLPGDSYDTPEDAPRYLGDRLALGTRWFFLFHFSRIVLKSRRLAIRGVYNDELWVKASLEHLRDVEGCGGRFHVRGMNLVRSAGGPLVFIGNHMSTLETFVLPCLLVPIQPITFIVKESLVRHPFFGPIMRSRRPIVVGRRHPREDLQAVLTQGPKILGEGTSIIVFPQASRSEVFDPSLFNTLGIKLARKARVGVIPIALRTDFLGNGRLIKDFGPVRRDRPIHIEFGERLAVHGTGEAQHRTIVRFIESRLDSWKREEASA